MGRRWNFCRWNVPKPFWTILSIMFNLMKSKWFGLVTKLSSLTIFYVFTSNLVLSYNHGNVLISICIWIGIKHTQTTYNFVIEQYFQEACRMSMWGGSCPYWSFFFLSFPFSIFLKKKIIQAYSILKFTFLSTE
jgi:hypothetical protein